MNLLVHAIVKEFGKAFAMAGLVAFGTAVGVAAGKKLFAEPAPKKPSTKKKNDN